MKNKFTCKLCHNNINIYDYFTNDESNYYLCSKECADKISDDEIYHVKICSAYKECKQLNNIRQKCMFKENYSNPFNTPSSLLKEASFCSAAEASMIKSNVKLLNFVEESEKRATELNNETLNLTKDNIKLAKAMLAVSLVNLVLIVVQIGLQIFLK